MLISSHHFGRRSMRPRYTCTGYEWNYRAVNRYFFLEKYLSDPSITENWWDMPPRIDPHLGVWIKLEQAFWLKKICLSAPTQHWLMTQCLTEEIVSWDTCSFDDQFWWDSNFFCVDIVSGETRLNFGQTLSSDGLLFVALGLYPVMQ